VLAKPRRLTDSAAFTNVPRLIRRDVNLTGSFVKPVALFVATRWERQALQRVLPTDRAESVESVPVFAGERAGQSYCLVQGGVGPEAARAAGTAVMKSLQPSAVISTGFACALVPATIGDVLIASEVGALTPQVGEEPRETVPCDRRFVEYLAGLAQAQTVGVRIGTFVSVPTVVCRAEEKQELRRRTGALGLDMESWELGRLAQQFGIPFAVVRTVSDLVDETLPLDFNLFLRPTGWLSGLQALLLHPSSLVGLNRLRKQSRVAAERLGAVIEVQAAEGFGRAAVATR